MLHYFRLRFWTAKVKSGYVLWCLTPVLEDYIRHGNYVMGGTRYQELVQRAFGIVQFGWGESVRNILVLVAGEENRKRRL